MKLLSLVNSFIFKTVYAGDQTGGTVRTDLPFQIPSLAGVVTFAIRTLLLIAGLMAFIFLVTGALSWVTSGGDKENVKKAQEKIQAAIIGLIILILVLAVMMTIETVFKQQICVGLTCDLKFPSIIQ